MTLGSALGVHGAGETLGASEFEYSETKLFERVSGGRIGDRINACCGEDKRNAEGKKLVLVGVHG